MGYNETQLAEAFERFNTYGNPFGGEAGLNGHFWCVRPDGTVWDEEDLGQEECRKVLRMKNKDVYYYECQNPLTNAIMTKKLQNHIKVITGDYETSLTLLDECYGEFEARCCMFNATIRAKRCGGKVVFGSVGLQSDDKKVTAWLYGGKGFSTFADFTRETVGGDYLTLN